MTERSLKLGKLPPRLDPRTLQLVRYLRPDALPAAPARLHLERSVPNWPIYGNDRYGDCVFADIGHQIEAWTANASSEQSVTDADVLGAYSAVTGFNPADPSTDQGTVWLDALNYWRRTGVGGHQIAGYVSVAVDKALARTATWLFGGLQLGIALPLSAQAQVGKVWTVGRGSNGRWGSWGGHAVPVLGYDASYLYVVTWGLVQRMTWGFFNRYCVSPETRVLTDDLRWVPAGDLVVGEGLMAFDEEALHPRGEKGHSRHWKRAVVEATPVIRRPCFDLKFDDGTEVRCSSDHQWLTHHNGGARWLATSRLRCDPKYRSNVVKPLETWETASSRDAGYLAAAFDGEGHLSQRDLTDFIGIAGTSIGFSQKDNAMLDEVSRCLKEFGFIAQQGVAQSGVHRLTISRRKEVLRLLGSIRPVRLLNKFRPERFGQVSMKTVKLVSRKFVGEQPVVALKTSSGTYLAEGLASHNCDEAYAALSPEWISQATQRSPEGFDLATLQSDLAAIAA